MRESTRVLGLVRWQLNVCVLLCGVLGAIAAHGDQRGKIEGKFEVTPSGSAHYSIGITVPPGTRGMQPDLSLNYDSNGSDGILGTGWSLGGISMITHCPPTLAQDGHIAPVDFVVTDDRLCLDGERLVGKFGLYGKLGSQYRTEHDIWSRVLASVSGPGNFAGRFEVDSRNGRIALYGYVDSTHDARIEAQASAVTRVWPIARVTDHDGNVMRFNYGEDTANGEFWPDSITYTENPNAGVPEPGFARVEFSYATRTDVTRSYIAGSLVTSSKLLTKITTCLTTTTCSAANTVMEYRLAYETSPDTGRSRLISITQCGANNECLPPTVFTWQPDPAPGWATNTDFRLPDELYSTDNPRSVLVDLNNDGYPDFVQAFKGSADDNIETELNLQTGFSSAVTQWALPTYLFRNGHSTATLVDLDGDGYPDLVEGWRGSGDNNATTHTWINKRAGTGGASSAWQAADTPWKLPGNGMLWDYYWESNRQLGQLIDVNGDGRPDFVEAYLGTGGGSEIHTYLNTGNGWAAEEPATGLRLPNALWNYTSDKPRQIAGLVDVNGDGLPDYVRSFFNGVSTTRETWINTGTTFTRVIAYDPPVTLWDMVNADAPSRRLGDFVDLNGDGLADIVLSYNGANGTDRREVYLNTGAGWTANQTAWLPPTNLTDDSTGFMLIHAAFVDVNADGRPDILESYQNPNGVLHSAVYLNTGAGFTGAVAGYALPDDIWGTVDWSTEQIHGALADLNGDGTVDYAYAYRNSAPSTTRVTYLNATGVGDRITHVQDGLTATLDVTYAPLTQSSVYTKGPLVTLPLANVVGPSYVVSRYTQSDGIGGARSASMGYSGLLWDVLRRASLGMASTSALDEVRNVLSTTTYNQAFPEEGQVLTGEVVVQSTGFSVSKTTNTYDHVTTQGVTSPWGLPTYFHFVRLRHQQVVKHELNNALVSTSDTDMDYDTYGNVSEKRVDYNDGNTSRTTTTYSTDVTDLSSWLLNLPTSVAVTGMAPGFAEPTPRTKTFTYAPGTGRVTHDDVEPNDAALKVTSAYTYDPFGNATAIAVTGSNFADRTTLRFYDSTGRFVVMKVNEEAQTTTAAWNGAFGVVTMTQGPNFSIPAATYTFDPLGRPTGGAAPGGSVTTTISRAESDSACPALTKMVIYDQTTGSPTSFICKDSYDRTIRAVITGFDGTAIYKDTEFDTLGHVLRTSRPHFSYDTPKWTVSAFDVLDRVVSVTLPSGSLENTTTTFDYTTPLTTVSTDPLGHRRTEIRDCVNRIVEVRDDYNNSTRYTPDPFGNLTKVIDAAGNQTTAQFDRAGHKTQLNDPDSGITTYDYNALGELLHMHDARNVDTTYVYDRLGRMVQRTDGPVGSDPGGVSHWTYDVATNGVGKLALETGPEAQFSRSYTYDTLGRLTSMSTSINGSARLFSYTYDAYNRLDTITYPSSFAVKREYNTYGYLSKVRQPPAVGNTIYWTGQILTAEGQVQQEQLGSQIIAQNYYSPHTGQLTSSYSGVSGSAALQNTTYQWDIVGNLVMRSDVEAGLSEIAFYDNLNRLVLSYNAQASLSTSYDAIGNISYKTGTGSYTYPAPGAPHPHAVTATSDGSKSYGYDNAGNMTNYAGATLTYSPFGKPRTIQTPGNVRSGAYTYDANHNLIIRTETATDNPTQAGTTVYVDSLYEEYTRAGVTEFRHYIDNGSRHFAIYTTKTSGSPDLSYLLVDHLGSTQVVTDSAGVPRERQAYDPWGLRRNANWSQPSGTIFSSITPAFTGHTQFDLFGLVDMKARMYSPTLGRFLSPDSIVQFPYSTQGLNRYTYVNDNPLSFTDPDGHSLWSWLRRQNGKTLGNAIVWNVYISTYLVLAYYCGPGVAAFGASLASSGVQAQMNGEQFGKGLPNALLSAYVAGVAAGVSEFIPAGGTSLWGIVVETGESAALGAASSAAIAAINGQDPGKAALMGAATGGGVTALKGVGEVLHEIVPRVKIEDLTEAEKDAYRKAGAIVTRGGKEVLIDDRIGVLPTRGTDYGSILSDIGDLIPSLGGADNGGYLGGEQFGLHRLGPWRFERGGFVAKYVGLFAGPHDAAQWAFFYDERGFFDLDQSPIGSRVGPVGRWMLGQAQPLITFTNLAPSIPIAISRGIPTTVRTSLSIFGATRQSD